MKKMTVDCKIEQKNFTNEAGEEFAYNSFTIVLDGNSFSLFPRKEDKKLINYILENTADYQ